VVFQDESVDWVDALFRGLGGGDQAIVPRHWALEISNSFLMAVRRGRMKREELDRALQILLALPIQADLIADSVVFEKIPVLAEKSQLTMPRISSWRCESGSRFEPSKGQLRAPASSAGATLAR